MVLFAPFGEVAEWSKAHAWKVCIRKRIEGSNPSLSANNVKRPHGAFLHCQGCGVLDESPRSTNCDQRSNLDAAAKRRRLRGQNSPKAVLINPSPGTPRLIRVFVQFTPIEHSPDFTGFVFLRLSHGTILGPSIQKSPAASNQFIVSHRRFNFCENPIPQTRKRFVPQRLELFPI